MQNNLSQQVRTQKRLSNLGASQEINSDYHCLSKTNDKITVGN
jgi:hypothetical protein